MVLSVINKTGGEEVGYSVTVEMTLNNSNTNFWITQRLHTWPCHTAGGTCEPVGCRW